MEAELEEVEREIVDVKKEIKRIEELLAGHGDRAELPGLHSQLGGLQVQLGALREEEVILLKQAQGAMPPSVTRMSCVSRWLSALPTCCLRTLSGASDSCSSITLLCIYVP